MYPMTAYIIKATFITNVINLVDGGGGYLNFKLFFIRHSSNCRYV